jgi:hypothetical protein
LLRYVRSDLGVLTAFLEHHGNAFAFSCATSARAFAFSHSV